MTTTALALHAPDAIPDWLDRERYPFRTRLFATSDGRMSYVDEGAGPPVLLVHGTPTWSFEWREVIAALSAHHRVIAPDHLGFGLSDKPAGAPYAPADHARRLLALFDALDLREVVLVVHDFGGPIGLPIALERADRVARVVALNTWMWPNGDDPRVVRIDRVVRSAIGRFLYRWLNVSPRLLLPASFGDRRKLTRALHRQFLAPFARRAEREALYALACALAGSDDYYASLWARRARLAEKPLTIVWGEKDPAFGRAQLDRWIGAFPRAEVRRLPDVGHFVAEEDPASVVRAIREAG
jgi:haloalkane dehalogenase